MATSHLIAACLIAPSVAVVYPPMYPPRVGFDRYGYYGPHRQLEQQNETYPMHQASWTPEQVSPSACTAEEKAAKKYDVVVFGATSIVGQLAAEYLVHHPDKPSFLLAGRDHDKLVELSTRLSSGAAGLPFEQSVRRQAPGGVATQIANLNNFESLVKLAKEAKVVLSYAGPYDELNGEAMIKAAIQSCAHYVDIAGETVWRANMMKAYGRTAMEKGVAVVQAAGLTVSLLADFLAASAARDLSQLGQGPPQQIMLKYKKMNGIPGGTAYVSSKYAVQKYGQVRDPYIFAPGTPAQLRVDEELDGMEHPVAQNIQGMMWYPAARMDAPLVRRTMHMMFPKAAVSVKEAQTLELDAEIKSYAHGMQPFTQMHTAPPRNLMKRGSFDVEAVARGHGSAARVVASCTNGDPGYLGSSKSSVELALGLAQAGTAVGTGGYLTPATALGVENLEKRLTKSFMTVQHLPR